MIFINIPEKERDVYEEKENYKNILNEKAEPVRLTQNLFQTGYRLSIAWIYVVFQTKRKQFRKRS